MYLEMYLDTRYSVGIFFKKKKTMQQTIMYNNRLRIRASKRANKSNSAPGPQYT